MLQADSGIYQAEKQVKELGDKASAENKQKVEDKIKVHHSLTSPSSCLCSPGPPPVVVELSIPSGSGAEYSPRRPVSAEQWPLSFSPE